MSIERARLLLLMKKAFKAKQSGTSLYWELRAEGRVIRKTDFFRYWSTVTQVEQKAGRMRFVRKDRYPTKADMVDQPWYKMSAEYMYKVKVQSRLRPDLPVTERFVNLMSDVPMTAGMITQGVIEKWAEWE
ncbi:unnamed protein product, partial [marine sediment metagenome]